MLDCRESELAVVRVSGYSDCWIGIHEFKSDFLFSQLAVGLFKRKGLGVALNAIIG